MSWAKEWIRWKGDRAQVQGVLMVPEGEHQEWGEVQARVAALHQDFEGKVLCDRIWGEIPRGPHIWGHIELKPGTASVCRLPIHLTSEI